MYLVPQVLHSNYGRSLTSNMDEHSQAKSASEEAIHKAKNAQQAVEAAREAQNLELVEEAARRTKEALLEGLKEVFSNDNDTWPGKMTVILQRVPILCSTVLVMHEQIENMDKKLEATNENIKWAVRIIIGAVILGLMKILFMP